MTDEDNLSHRSDLARTYQKQFNKLTQIAFLYTYIFFTASSPVTITLSHTCTAFMQAKFERNAHQSFLSIILRNNTNTIIPYFYVNKRVINRPNVLTKHDM